MRKNYILLFLAALLAPLGAKAQITEFPYILDFENGLDGWTVIDADGDGYTWEVSSSTDGIPSHSGSAMATSRSYSTSYVALTPDNWLVSPAIVLDNTVRQLSWWHHTQDPSYPAEHYAVYISTTGNTVADFTDEPVYETTLTAADNEYNIHQVMLNGYEGETIYIAFRHYNCTDMFYFHLDDISIEAAPNCLPPENLAFENITTTGADMTFDMPACATDGVRFLINGEEQPVLTSGSYSFTNLEPGTVYTIHLYSLCGDGDTSYATTAQFMTECVNITLPYLFGFEGDHANCYNYEHMYWRTEASNAHSGNIAFYSSGSTGHYVVTPVIEAPEDADGNIVFEFYALPLNSTYYGTDVTFKLYVSTEASLEFDSTFSVVMDTAISGNDYMSIKLNLAPYAGQNITIAIENTTNGSPYLFIDDIAVRSTLAPVVTLPANANADANLAATFAAVITEGMLENMTYTWTSTMEAAGNATMSANDSLLTITYTAAGEDTITVVATNDHGSDTATIHVYVRLCEIVDSLPWSENFDSAAATECWTFVDADGNGVTWTVNTSGYLYGNYNSAGPDDWAITPAIAVPDDADNMVLSWDVYGDSYLGLNNFYQVRVSPSAGMAIANFTDTLFSESYPTAVWTTRTAAISQYAGQTVRFAFRHINTGDDNGMRIDNVAVRTSLNPILSVSGPGSVQLGDTAIFTATLNEGSTDGLTFTFTSQDANAIASTDSNVYTIVYTATGTDTITVVATNNYGADTVIMPVTIIDLNPASLPYTCGFEPEGQDTSWFIDNHNVNGWYIDTAAHNGGSYSLYISADSGATNGYNITASSIAHAYRAIRFNQAGQYSVSFDWQADGESTYDFIRAYMAPIDATLPTSYSGITYGSLPTGFIAIDGGNRLNQSTGWQNVGTALTIDAPTTMLMVFSWRNDFSSGTQPPAAIDNIDVRMLSCLQPTALAVDSTGADFVAFSWVPAGEETSWEVTFNGESTVVTDTFYVADDLEANTEYSISVRAICGEGDTSLSTSATTRTECGAITLPYHEGFENGGETCWRFATTGTYSNYHSINTYNYAEGTHSLRLYMNNTGNKSYAIMPELDNVNTLMVTFQNYDYYDELNQLEVGTMASPTDIASFVPFFSTVGTDTWEAQEVRFDADTTGNRYIAFRATATTASATYILIDDVTVMVAPSCHRPESVSATDIEATSATITITDTTEVNNYQIIVVNTATGDTAYSDLVNSTSQEVTGLTAFTEYTVTVYAVCDDGTITSSVNTTFRTACENGNCEFTVALADTYGDGWNGNAINVWQNGEVFTSLTIANGSAANANVSVCLGSPVELIWQSGSYAYETSFTITSADDSVILALDGDSLVNGDTLVVFDGLCGVQFVYSGDIVDTTEPGPGPQPLPCDAPTITGATATDNNVTVIWNGTASNYEVAIVAGAWQEPADVVTTTGPGYTFTGLQASTQYTVGVRAVCADTVSDWATRNVTTAAPADTTDTIGIRLAETALFSLYPNPATTTVTVDLGSHSQATVAVIDQSGRLNGEWRVENGKLELNVGRLAKGAYYVRVTTAESTSVRKLIVR